MLPAVKDHHEVSVTFQLPCLHAHYPAKADQYISHLIGHEGPGSLLSALKSRGWATEVVAGIEEDGYDMNSFTYLFGVTITLTEAGLHAGPGYGLAAVALLFQYINMIREAGEAHHRLTHSSCSDNTTCNSSAHVLLATFLIVSLHHTTRATGNSSAACPCLQTWLADLPVACPAAGPQEWVWREMAAIADMKFRFHEEDDASDTVSRLAGLMHIREPHHLLVADFLHRDWRPDLVGGTACCTHLMVTLLRSGSLLSLCGAYAGAGHWREYVITAAFWLLLEVLLACYLHPPAIATSSSFMCLMQVSQLLALLHPASASYRVDLLTKQHAQLKEGLALLLPGSTTIREPWFDMEAVSAQLPQEMCSTWATQQAAEDMRLPPPNPYVATDFSLRELQQAPAQHSSCSSLPGTIPVLPGPPTMVLDVPGLRLWYKGDDIFKMPRTNAYFRLWSPALHDSPRAAALSHLALKLLEDVLAEDGYLADVAGLHYSTSPEGQAGLELRVDGFSHKHAAFVQRLFDVLVTLPGSASFAVVKEALVRRYSNSNMQVGCGAVACCGCLCRVTAVAMPHCKQ
jgi:secreted Zn-dependent insulinase-like peptidase